MGAGRGKGWGRCQREPERGVREKGGALDEWEGRGFTGVIVPLHWQGQIVLVSNRSGPAKERPHSLGLPGRRTRRYHPFSSSQTFQ